MVAIITDSSSNFTPAEAAQAGVILIPLTIMFGDEQFRDGVDITAEEFYAKLTSCKSFPHTSQLTEFAIEEAVRTGLSQADEVLILPIASALSGSYERCVQVASKYSGVYVFDTTCTTVMLKMLVLEAVANKEKSAAEIMDILRGFRPKIKLLAALDTLEYLGKGGRISKTVAALGTVLKIKPVITINLKGEVEVLSKQFGIAKGISYVASSVDKTKIDFTRPVYAIYTMNDSNCISLFEKLGVEHNLRQNICPVIGTHIGPDAAGIVYAEK